MMFKEGITRSAFLFMQRRYGMVQEFDECPTLSIWIAD